VRCKYGLTLEALTAMHKQQGGRCGACEQPHPIDEMKVDHDHATGQVRGLLCHGCNVSIGLLRDSPERARKLALYLERHVPALPFARKGAA
jgi:hypothetical protein